MEENREVFDSANRVVQTLMDLLCAQGVKEIVCSPGSRNTPLLIAAEARSELKKTIVVDERCAAFVALGKSIVSGRPVALVCTSGTAMLNYAPALAEAYYQGIPLIAITADRPKEWIDQDDSQTIRQQDTFSNFVKGSYDIISGRDDETFLWYVNRIANEGILKAVSGKPGPVHFNVRLADPLGTMTPRVKKGGESGRECDTRVISLEESDSLPPHIITDLAEKAAGKKILLISGYLPPDARLNRAVGRLISECANVEVKAETISNLHLSAENYSIDSSLCIFSEEEKETLRPDILITIGGSLVSRMMKEYLRKYSPKEHWAVGSTDFLSDCYQSLTKRIDAKPSYFMSAFAGALSKAQKQLSEDIPSYGDEWKKLWNKAKERREGYIEKAPWSDMKAYSIMLSKMPEDANLFLSNGTSIRYAQILTNELCHTHFCNRGVSGIDGSTSTAIGGSTVYGGLTVLLTGDMSFAYDLGALGSRLADGRMRIIVVNNAGGGIFRFIRSTSTLPMREKYFCSDPQPPVEGLAAAYGWKYLKGENEEELQKSLDILFADSQDAYALSDQPIILEVITPPEISAEILKDYLKS